MFAMLRRMSGDLAADAQHRVNDLEDALRRLTHLGMVGPKVHDLAERFAPMFYAVRRDIDAWERTRQARET
jgi:hypothetical protein